MNKKNENKRLCWNCDGGVSFQLENCPYCGVNLTVAQSTRETVLVANEEIPPSPYSGLVQESEVPLNEPVVKDEKKEMYALLLLLPGIVLCLFGIALLFFSKEGVFTLEWKKHFAYFYFLGSIPLLYLGYKALK